MTYKKSNTKEEIAYHMRHIGRILDPEQVKDNSWIKNIDINKEMSKQQRNVLKSWVKERGLRGLKIGATQNRLYFFRKFGVFIKGKDWKKVNKRDVMNFLDSLKKEGASESSMFVYKNYLSSFLQWVHNMKGDKFPSCVSWIDVKAENRRMNSKKKMPYSEEPDKWFSDEEFMKMVKIAEPRNKAILWLLWDSGMRVGELINLKIKDVLIYSNTAGDIVVEDGKTGNRKIPICKSVLPLKHWVQNHAYNKDGDAPLFYQYSTNRYGKKLEWSGIAGIIRKVGKLAGLRKRCHVHMLRHSKVIRLRRDGFSDEEICYMMGWNSTNMMKVYFHVDTESLRRKINIAEGIENKSKEKQIVKVEDVVCPFCQEHNSFTALFCEKCGGILDEQVANERLKEEIKYKKLLENLKGIEKLPEQVKELKKVLAKIKMEKYKDYKEELTEAEFKKWEEKYLEAEELREMEGQE